MSKNKNTPPNYYFLGHTEHMVFSQGINEGKINLKTLSSVRALSHCTWSMKWRLAVSTHGKETSSKFLYHTTSKGRCCPGAALCQAAASAGTEPMKARQETAPVLYHWQWRSSVRGQQPRQMWQVFTRLGVEVWTSVWKHGSTYLGWMSRR